MIFDELLISLIETFNSFEERAKDSGYFIIGLKVPNDILNTTYKRFVKEGISEIGSLPVERKRRYFEIAKKYYQTEPEVISASLSAYTIDLITSNS